MTNRPPENDSLSVLVVEDEFLLALDLQHTLEEAGYRVMGPARKVAEAIGLLKANAPDVAILDVNLLGERVTPVARLLTAMGVPFVLSTADDEFARSDEALSASENLGKPINHKRMLTSLRALTTLQS